MANSRSPASTPARATPVEEYARPEQARSKSVGWRQGSAKCDWRAGRPRKDRGGGLYSAPARSSPRSRNGVFPWRTARLTPAMRSRTSRKRSARARHPSTRRGASCPPKGLRRWRRRSHPKRITAVGSRQAAWRSLPWENGTISASRTCAPITPQSGEVQPQPSAARGVCGIIFANSRCALRSASSA